MAWWALSPRPSRRGWRMRRSTASRRQHEHVGYARRRDATCGGLRRYHLMAMSNEDILSPGLARAGKASRATFRGPEARGPIIEQEGREIPAESLGSQFHGFRFDFANANANLFGNLSREQRLARLDALAKLLDVAFILPGTNIRYGIDGLIGLIPVVGDIITTAISLLLVLEAPALRAPWPIPAPIPAPAPLHSPLPLLPPPPHPSARYV